MIYIKTMFGVRAGVNNDKNATLSRNEEGRLIVAGNCIDLLDLIKWIEENPLNQFRVITAQDGVVPFEPSECLKHLFSPKGTVL